MKTVTLFKELDLNEVESFDGLEVYGARKIPAEAVVRTINHPENQGLPWLTPAEPKISMIKQIAEAIVEKKQRATMEFKLAKAILAVLNKPRNVADKKKPTRPRMR